MSKRYQVFVSSTYEDLKEERNRVIQALLNINCIPCGMEYFPAADEDAWNCIERLIPECDYYVLILGGMYGSIPKGKQKSYTHLEYELAVKHGVPVLGLLHKDPSQLPSGRCESLPARRKKLSQFRSQVGRKLCRFWNSPDQLPGELLASLTHQFSRFPRTGWVRGDSIADEEAKNEIIKLRKKVDAQEKQIAELREREAGEEQNLASGDEEFQLLGEFSTKKFTGKGKNITTHILGFKITTSWNRVLKFIRNDRFPKWDQHVLATSICGHVRKMWGLEEFSEYRGEAVLYDGESDKISLQLNALGLINRRGTGWEFTSKGLAQASKLLAMKKGQTGIDDSDWCRIEWDKIERPYDAINDYEEWRDQEYET